MFDSGAGLNTIPEEAVLEVINLCEAAGMGMGNPNHPIPQLETWQHSEECRGVAGGVTLPLIGAVSLLLTFVDKVSGKRETAPPKFNTGCESDRLGTHHPWRYVYRLRGPERPRDDCSEERFLPERVEHQRRKSGQVHARTTG